MLLDSPYRLSNTASYLKLKGSLRSIINIIQIHKVVEALSEP